MRATDHQFLQPLYMSVMDRVGANGVRFDAEGSGYGFRTVRRFDANGLAPVTTCQMKRPA
jgi:branched-chain amino acid transport system substrate-binding protein